jgi:serine/alanine adding enzyme
MPLSIRLYEDSDGAAWDEYVHNHPDGTLYHLSGWKNIVEKTYGHKTYFLLATDTHGHTQTETQADKILSQASDFRPLTSDTLSSTYSPPCPISGVTGILPLVHMKHFLFGNRLISMPFMDMGGILADNEKTEQALLTQAFDLAKSLKADEIELRHNEPLTWLSNGSRLTAHSKDTGEDPSTQSSALSPQHSIFYSPISCCTKSHKSRMLLDLPESSKILWNSFRSKFRNKIKKPMKEGLTVQIGGEELIDDFYQVFLVNMRDLGSPVHSKNLIENVILEFKQTAKIFIAYKNSQPMACSMAIGFKDILMNPWASSLKQYSTFRPNTLLYWSMLEYASDNGYRHFDFGRSTVGEGTFNFKAEWGATPRTLHWQYISSNGSPPAHLASDSQETHKFSKAVQYWQKLPVPMTRILGPMIRKHISL